MAAWTCGWCGTHAHMKPVDEGFSIPVPDDDPSNYLHDVVGKLFTTMECASCTHRSIAYALRDSDSGAPGSMTRMHSFWRKNDPDRAYPQWVEGQNFNYAPQHIAKAASEAYRCHSIGSFMAAILMARTSIEAAAKDHGITVGSLVKKIDELAGNGHIRKNIKDAAHQVRKFGNDMAHGDIKVEVTEEDSLQVLQLLTFILQDLYEVTDLMGKVGVSLDGRKASGAE